MSGFLHRLLALYAERPPRERLLIAVAGSCLILSLLWLSVVGPISRMAESGNRRIEIADQQLRVMERLQQSYDESLRQLSSVEERIRGVSGGNLRTDLESLAKQASLSIDSMEPEAAPTHPNFRETKVEVGLRSVSLSQVINYLHRIETSERVYSIKSLRIKTRPDRSDLLDVNFSVSSFEPI